MCDPSFYLLLLASCELSIPHVKFKVLVQKCCKRYLSIINPIFYILLGYCGYLTLCILNSVLEVS